MKVTLSCTVPYQVTSIPEKIKLLATLSCTLATSRIDVAIDLDCLLTVSSYLSPRAASILFLHFPDRMDDTERLYRYFQYGTSST